jgi:hypothetical protein
MTDLGFRLAQGWAAFEADWQAMIDHLVAQGVMTQQTADGSWLYDEDGNKFLPTLGPVMSDKVRYDFALIDPLYSPRPQYDSDGNLTNNPVNRGPHVNLRVKPRVSGLPINQISEAVIGWYRALPWKDITVQGETKRTYVHTLPNGTEALAREIMDADGNVIGYEAMPVTPHTVFG